jgi:hypothetical protein
LDKESLTRQLKQSEQNLSQIITRSKDQFLVQNANGKSEYVAKKEWDLINALKSAQTELMQLREEKDKYYLKYFELLGMRGEMQQEDMDDSLIEMANLKYQNNLQLAETRERQLKRRLSKSNLDIILVMLS